MGADAPIPPIAMNAAAPDGAPPRRGAIVFSESVHSWFLNVKLQNIWKTWKINNNRMQVFAHLM
jgi:hypothetical protein